MRRALAELVRPSPPMYWILPRRAEKWDCPGTELAKLYDTNGKSDATRISTIDYLRSIERLRSSGTRGRRFGTVRPSKQQRESKVEIWVALLL
eukprot:3222654-Pyramimonas_sp.AAC.2